MTPQLRKFFQAIGKTGGKKTAERMSPEERQERARNAAAARWKKRKKASRSPCSSPRSPCEPLQGDPREPV
jgi:hypothetical protein